MFDSHCYSIRKVLICLCAVNNSDGSNINPLFDWFKKDILYAKAVVYCVIVMLNHVLNNTIYLLIGKDEGIRKQLRQRKNIVSFI